MNNNKVKALKTLSIFYDGSDFLKVNKVKMVIMIAVAQDNKKYDPCMAASLA